MVSFLPLRAQNKWPSPEVEQMYEQAKEYLSMGNFPSAIAMYQKAIQLAPNQVVLYRDLGKAYYLSGNYRNAEETIEPLLKAGEVDDQAFQIMAACQAADGEKKKAKQTLQHGLERFPHSGILYHEMGKVEEDEKEEVYALETYLDGIKNDPGYRINYYEAARMYMGTNKFIWTIIYGEMFVNMERQTPRADEMRKTLLDAYEKLFFSPNTDNVPKYGRSKKEETIKNFEQAVYSTYIKLSPVISDGITTESLTMLRTRFLMEWYSSYANKYPYSLFAYQDEMARSGFFDVYNEWLFAKMENLQQYEAWNKFHDGAMSKFDTWANEHALHPEKNEFYNDRNIDDLFTKKKK